jgi:hypothetical protein
MGALNEKEREPIRQLDGPELQMTEPRRMAVWLPSCSYSCSANRLTAKPDSRLSPTDDRGLEFRGLAQPREI